MKKRWIIVGAVLLFSLSAPLLFASEKSIGVFIALADNIHQGIAKVPKAIGNGDDPEHNLYWGCTEGLKGVFGKSKQWKLKEKIDHPKEPNILRIRIYKHLKKDAILSAKAYKGSAIKQCIRDFEEAVRTGAYDMVVYIGHNGLMDFNLAAPVKMKKRKKTPDCAVLCCKSEIYFKKRIEEAGGRPILLTTQLMYPGSFILHAAADEWLNGASLSEIRERAGAEYALNQKISKRSGMGVFAKLEKSETNP